MLGYTSWHQLLVYSCISCLLSKHMFMLLLFSCLFIILFSYLISAVILVIILCTLLICTSFLPLHTHSPGRFLTTLDLHVQILDALFLLFRCSLRLYASRSAGNSPYSIAEFLSFLPSYYFLILVISDSVLIQVFIYMISCVDAYMWYCSNHDLITVRIYSLFRVT